MVEDGERNLREGGRQRRGVEGESDMEGR